MTDVPNRRNVFSRFAQRGPGGLVGLVVVTVMAFFLGALLFSDSPSPSNSQDRGSAEKSPADTIWTCSMHPQIKLPKPGKCPICFMDLIPLDVGSGEDAGPRQLKMSESAKELARIQTTPAVRALAEAEVRMVGKITYDETRLAYMTAWVPGRLDRLYADFTGVTVQKGDHMVYMYSPELLAAQEELLQAGSVINALSRSTSSVLKSTADATIKAAREKLRLFGLSADQIADIEASQSPTDHLTINAPIGGVVVHKSAQEGMYVKTGTKIYTIADLTKLWVMFEAYESDLPWIRYGQNVSFTSPSFPGKSFEAIISFIDPVVNSKTRTVGVRAIVDNKDLRLKPDMFVRGVVQSRVNASGDVVSDDLAGMWIGPMHPEIVRSKPGLCDICGMDLVSTESLGYATENSKHGEAPLLIPASAPMITGVRAVVYVELPSDNGPLFEGREVQLGPRAGDFYVVKAGIEEGEMVVTNGAFKIDSELQIRAKPSMMSPTGGVMQAGHQHGQPTPHTQNHEKMSAEPAPEREPANAVASLTPVYRAYFDIQRALTEDDVAAARIGASLLNDQVLKVDMSLFSAVGHNRWMELSESIGKFALELEGADHLESARQSFYHLSITVIDTHASFGHSDETNFFLSFCPMAHDGQGAHWLQTVDTVYNPFYGASMLRCGEIQDTLAAYSSKGRK